MKKYLPKIFVLFFVCCLFIPSVSAKPKDIFQLPDKFIDAVVRSSYDKAFSLCSDDMKAQLRNAEGLKIIWQDVQKHTGAYQNHSKPYMQALDNDTYIYFYPAAFEANKFVLQVTVIKNKIAGFFIRSYFIDESKK